ncbi:MAG: choloylglycine hydrolase family protein [Bacteroidales bacterium]|nr:choloylglycine hydrolase family protein [Bacteroidales bacterium]
MEEIKAKILLFGAVMAAGMAVTADAYGQAANECGVKLAFNGAACTGIGLMAKDGGYVMARTMEWAGPYVPYGRVVIPRGERIVSYTPQGKNGLEFTAKYGVAGIAPQQKEFIIEGLNEKGLQAGLFYFPKFGKYVPYNPQNNAGTLADMQFVTWVLGSFATIDEVKEALQEIDVVSIAVGGDSSTVHWRIGEPGGRQVVLEFINGEAQFHENPVGVFTNGPEFSWHLSNLSNYINLYPGVAKSQKWGDFEITSIGGGSGALGLPGDMTSPSRFIRIAYFKATAPQLENSYRTVLQAFHILNNFDIPIGIEHPLGEVPDVPSATPCTSASDLKELKLYYRTTYNSTIRCIDLKSIDFDSVKYEFKPLDPVLEEPVEMVIVK